MRESSPGVNPDISEEEAIALVRSRLYGGPHRTARAAREAFLKMKAEFPKSTNLALATKARRYLENKLKRD